MKFHISFVRARIEFVGLHRVLGMPQLRIIEDFTNVRGYYKYKRILQMLGISQTLGNITKIRGY